MKFGTRQISSDVPSPLGEMRYAMLQLHRGGWWVCRDLTPSYLRAVFWLLTGI